MAKIFQGKKQLFFLVLYITDVFTYLISASVAMFMTITDIDDAYYTRFFLFTLLILLMNYTAFQLYKDKRSLFNDTDFMRILYAVLITMFISTVFILMFDPMNYHLFLALSISLILMTIVNTISRYVLYRIIYLFRKAGYDRKKVLFFGAVNEDLISKIKYNKSLGYEVVKTTSNMKILTTYLDKVDIVFLTRDRIDEKIMDMIIKYDRVNWKIVPSVLNLVLEPVSFDEFRDYPIINVSPSNIKKSQMIMKRFMDIVLSSIAIVALAIPFAVIAIIIKITMPGPVFFTQSRLGRNLKQFKVYKFRSMIVGADRMKENMLKKNEVKGLFKMRVDPRVTGFGRFLRRSCLDELPQVFNIFKGEMSIVGPRPHLKKELSFFKGWRMARFRVKPGLTGMWQVNGRHELNFDKAVLYDIYYIKNMSILLDIGIILKTIPAIVMTRGRY